MVDDFFYATASGGDEEALETVEESALDIRLCCLPGEGLDPTGACLDLPPG